MSRPAVVPLDAAYPGDVATASAPDAAPRPGPLVVAFVPGVTPGKWERIWNDRMPRAQLTLIPAPQAVAWERLHDRSAHMAFLRDVERDDDFHVITLYRERAVVVAPRDHPVRAYDELTLADLAGETLLDRAADGRDDPATLDLVAANVGLAIMPMSVARAHSRRELVARPVADAPESSVGLVWPAASPHPWADDLIGIVRGRTQNSSR